MTTENKTAGAPTLAQALADLSPAGVIGHANLTLVPLVGQTHSELQYVLAAEAIRAGTLTVTEVDQQAVVSELLAANSAEQMVLLLDGEELVGAKQNRILNTSILLPPGARTRIPVSCVEQGRWREVSQAFATGSYSPSSLRARKSRDVTESLRESGQARSDQGAVWEEVASNAEGMGASPSPTMAMSDAIAQRRDSLESYVEALPYPQGSRGVVAAINGRFAAADIFDRPRTLETVWPRLLTGYAIDALPREKQARRVFTAKAAGFLLEHAGQIACDVRPTAGAGQDWRITADDILGQALMVEGVCVHASMFPATRDDGDEKHEPGIAPPSRRRRIG